MSLERRLRESLGRRAGDATASPDAWDRITARTEGARRGWVPPALAAAAALALVVGMLAVVLGDGDGGQDGSEVVAGPGDDPIQPPARPEGECRPRATDGPEADEALLGWLYRESFPSARAVEMELRDGGTARVVATGGVITGDLMRDPDHAEICLRTWWASDPVEGSGDFVGYSDDYALLDRTGDSWKVSEVRRFPLVVPGEWSTVEVALLADDAQCAEGGQGVELVPRALVMEGDDPLTWALYDLFGGWSGVGEELWSALPLDSRLVSAGLTTVASEGEPQVVARVDVSAATEAGGGSCGMNARMEQIRRTALAQPGITDVVITVEGREEGIFQP